MLLHACLPYRKVLKNYGKPYHRAEQYRSVVGALQYLTFTRPDIAFFMNRAYQFMHNPMEAHVIIVKRILRYLKGTSTYNIHFKPCPIDSTTRKPSEKSAVHLTVRGYELIDEIKKSLEAACPSTVSCADIVTLATRDSVVLAGGQNYAALTGLRDGFVSNPNDVKLPGPSFSVSEALQAFTAKGMTLNDMVTLLGAHTVGFAHCNFFQDRLSDFQGSGSSDPSMDPALVSKLSTLCAASNNPTTFLDQNTSSTFDNQFYNQILLKRGVLQIDQELASDTSMAGIVSGFASKGVRFGQSFAIAMLKMGSLQVLVGNAGEIRKNCRVFNPAKSKN